MAKNREKRAGLLVCLLIQVIICNTYIHIIYIYMDKSNIFLFRCMRYTVYTIDIVDGFISWGKTWGYIVLEQLQIR